VFRWLVRRVVAAGVLAGAVCVVGAVFALVRVYLLRVLARRGGPLPPR